MNWRLEKLLCVIPSPPTFNSWTYNSCRQVCFVLYERQVSVSVVRINTEQLTMHFGAFKIEPRVIFRCRVLDLNDV